MSETVVGSGQTSSGLVVTSGNVVVVSGGTTINATVTSGGQEFVYSGGTAIGTNDGGYQDVESGGLVSATTIQADAVLIGGGGSATGTVVESAGLMQIGGTGVIDGATVSSGGVAWVYNSATISGATISGVEILGGTTSSTQFGTQAVSGGRAVNNVVGSAGAEYVGTGATTTGTILNSGGTQQVGGSTSWIYHYDTASGFTMSTNLSGGIASNTLVNSGGDQIVSSGGTATGTTVYGEQQVVLGGVASATTIEAGGALLAGSSTVSGTVVMGRGLEQLGVAAVDSGATVSAGGTQWVYNTAATTGTTLNGGIQVIGGVTSSPNFGTQATSGGTATATIVNSGGAEYVGTDGTASDTLVTSGGTQQVGGSVEWNYYYQVSAGVSGSTMSTNLSGGVVSGTILASGGTEIVSSGGTASGTTVSSGGLLEVASGGAIIDTHLLSGGTINLGYATYSAGASAVLNSATEVLTVTDGGKTYTLQLAGSYTGGFEVTSASNGTADIILCFYPGTRLAGAEGEIAVEDIAAGTLLKTLSGRLLPVRWLGKSEVSTRFGDPLRKLPIRIKAGALAAGVPARDLLVSPDHAVFVEGVLVQAAALVNHTTILRERDVPECFTYYHVELATHELLLAENCPAESFVDNVGRMHFSNWAEREALGDAAPIEEMAYPRVKSARQLPAFLRRRLEERAAGLRGAAAAA